jgi:multiple sugar transport system substrate-binding protein
MRHPIVAGLTGLVLAATAACSGGGSGASGATGITMWHGYTDAEAKAITALAQKWNGEHPKQKVQLIFNGGNDNALQKTLASFVSGKTPSIGYEYGSSITTLAQRHQTQNLTSLVTSSAGFNWNDFFPAERQATTVDGKIYGVPALVDNLALVYNKKLFDRAHLPYPTANWTWDDFRTAARKLADPAAKKYGWSYTNDGTEDTVWRYLALLWQAGGDLLTSDGRKSAIDSPAGLQAMQLLHDMAVTDKSVYLDTGDQQYQQLFNSGRIAMLWTGPWDLGSFDQVDYGVQFLPGKVTHATISGPDNYMLFGTGAAKQTAWSFLQWLLSPQVHLEFATATGDLPIRQSETKLPGYAAFLSKYPGNKVFMDNLTANATTARPNIPQYPKISQVLGVAVQSVLLGKARPQAALDSARDQIDQILAGA